MRNGDTERKTRLSALAALASDRWSEWTASIRAARAAGHARNRAVGWKPHLIALLIALAAFAADQWSKAAAVGYFEETQGVTIEDLRRVESVPVLGGLFGLRLVTNTGAAFGLFGSAAKTPLFLLIASVVGMAAVLWVYWRFSEDAWTRTAWALAVGGGFGNLLDRLRFRYVIDFIDVDIGSYQWPYFNLADAFLCVGAGMLIVSAARERRKERSS